MKKISFGIVIVTSLVTLLVSCGKSPEDKANALIGEDIKKVLYHPETYDPAETRIDSAFTPFDDPAFYDKAVQLCKVGVAIDEYDRNMKRAKSSMSIWGGPYQSAYGRNNYQEAKDKYDENEQNKKTAEIKAKKIAEELKVLLDCEKTFIGFKACHRYRAQNNAGQVNFGEMEFLFDKDFTKILASYDMDGDEYKAVQIVYKLMLGEDNIDEVDNYNGGTIFGE